MSLLRFHNVSKRYPDGSREVVVMDSVSFEIEMGDFVGLLGARRSGKSTLLRIAAGIERPDAGVVEFDGADIGRMSEGGRAQLLRRRGIALANGNWRSTGNRPVFEHVGVGLLSDGVTRNEAWVLAREALRRVGAGSRADVTTDRLSLGERIRVELARALVGEPRLLLIDEPAMLSSPSESRDLYALLRSLGQAPGLTVLVASEDVTAIRDARWMMSLDNGKLRAPSSDGEVVPFPDLRVGGGGRQR